MADGILANAPLEFSSGESAPMDMGEQGTNINVLRTC
jgi:hypothetical protein